MKFHVYQDLYHLSRQCANPRHPRLPFEQSSQWNDFIQLANQYKAEELYETFLETGEKYRGMDHTLDTVYNRLRAEYAWIKEKRAYYHVYPGVVEPLSRLNHKKVLATDISLPRTAINFQFPEGSHFFEIEHEQKTFALKSLLVTLLPETTTFSGHPLDKPRKQVLTIWMDFGEYHLETGEPILTYRRMPLEPGITLEESMHLLKSHSSIHMGLPTKEDTTEQVVRLVAGICLLSQGEDLVEPDVLNADLTKWQKTRDEKFVDKAHRRGKVGWVIGRNMEVNPHYRTGHFMHLKEGAAGRQTSRVVWRKGSVVKRQKVKELPTGELDD